MYKKIICVLLSAAMMFSFAACAKSSEDASAQTETQTKRTEQPAYTVKPDSVKKSETVYVNTDNYGTVSKISVTDWLHTDKGQVTVGDVSDLEGITNIKSDVEPVVDGKSLVWNMDTTDLYYSGISDKQLPVDIGIKYYLDGVETKTEALYGKSGKLRIDITMKNKLTKTITEDGKPVKLYLPVLVAGVAILPEGEYSNVAVKNGKSIGDGTKEIAVTLGAPGLSESLALSEDALGDLSSFDLSGECAISADVTDCKLGNLYFAVLPLCSLDIGLIVPDSMEDMAQNLEKVKRVLDTFDSMEVNDVLGMIVSDSGKVTELTGMVESAVNLYSSNKALIDVLQKYFTGENLETMMKLVKDMDSASVKEAIGLLSNPVLQRFFTDLPALSDDLESLMPILEQLNKDMEDPEVKAAFDKLPETLEQLTALKEQLDDNQEFIDALGVLVSSENLDTLTQLAQELDEFDLDSVASQFTALLGDSDSVLDRAKEWLAFGMDYKIYTDAAQETDTSLLFVYRTQSINIATTANVTETTTTHAEESPWYKKMFEKKYTDLT